MKMLATRSTRPVLISSVLIVFLFILVLSLYGPHPSQFDGFSDQLSQGFQPKVLSLPSLSSRPSPIPNIVHCVILKKDADSTLHLRFDHFLSIYGSLLYFKPTTIYLHTDHNASTIAAAASTGSKWTRAILNLPGVTTNEVVSPQYANGTKEIIKVEHKSDFVRIDQLYTMGGIYMDLDVLPLRSIAPLLNSGYKTVVGRQLHNRINNGIILAQPGAALTYLMQREGPLVFNGGWETHSIRLITPIAERLARFPCEVLIMDESAFSPTSWKTDVLDALFQPQNDTSISEQAGPQGLDDAEEDPIAWWDKRNEERRKWEMDFSQTYLLHAYKGRGYDVPGFEGISVKYVQRRDSNYALAAWPVVRHALENGIVESGDEEI